MTEQGPQRSHRWRRRYLVHPRYQVQFAILLILFQVNVGLLYQGVMQFRMKTLVQEAGTARAFMALDLWKELLPTMLFLSAGIAVIVYLIGIIFSNTIVGPMPRMKAALRAIASGDYGQRLKFRPGDAMEELADEINHLAESLGSRYAGSGPPQGMPSSDVTHGESSPQETVMSP